MVAFGVFSLETFVSRVAGTPILAPRLYLFSPVEFLQSSLFSRSTVQVSFSTGMNAGD